MLPQNHIGCDISKAALDLYDPRTGQYARIPNTAGAVAAFVAGLDARRDFVVLEATGVYDRLLRHALGAAGIGFARRNPAQVRNFGRSRAGAAKTDRIDARLLSDYGRAHRPCPDPLPCKEREHLQALARRRDQLVAIKAAQKMQLQDAFDAALAADIEATIAFLEARIKAVEALAEAALANADPATKEQVAILLSAPGVGHVTALILIANLPELGARSPKTIAALAGLAPINNDSGTRRGRRPIRGGRPRIRRALYMAALGAVRKCARFRTFFKAVAHRSASKKLALIAVARKLLTSLNAMIRDQKHYA